MKGDRFASDYERIRRQAGLAQAEFYDPDEPPDNSVADRVAEKAEETIAELTARAQQEATESRKRSAEEMDAVRKRTNERLRLASWARYGLTPPSPGACLELYLSIGWQLEHTAIGWQLLRPPTFTPRETQTNEMGS